MQNRFVLGVEFFNKGQFFDAHEAWEDVWRESEEPERRWLQGLVQVAVALHHESTGNRAGAASVLRRGIRNLETSPESLHGIDIARLRQHLAKAQAELINEVPLTRFSLPRVRP